MKCNDVQTLLTNGQGYSQSAEVQDHVADCPDCREFLIFQRSLEARLDGGMAVPTSLYQKAMNRVDEQAGRPLFARMLGNNTMKKILISSTALTAILVAGFLSLSGRASASSAIEEYNSMKAALIQAASKGELKISVKSSPEGEVTVSGSMNGKTLPNGFPLKFTSTRSGDVLDVKVTVDLAPTEYQSITFGKEHNSILLVPKDSKNGKIQIFIDPKTKTPVKCVTVPTFIFLGKDGKAVQWKAGASKEYSVKTKDGKSVKVVARQMETKPAKRPSLNARLLLKVGQTAEISLSPGS